MKFAGNRRHQQDYMIESLSFGHKVTLSFVKRILCFLAQHTGKEPGSPSCGFVPLCLWFLQALSCHLSTLSSPPLGGDGFVHGCRVGGGGQDPLAF